MGEGSWWTSSGSKLVRILPQVADNAPCEISNSLKDFMEVCLLALEFFERRGFHPASMVSFRTRVRESVAVSTGAFPLVW